jgi:hypothetical protein
MKRYMALGAVVAALGAGAAALGQVAAAGGAAAKQGDGGLSVFPALVERGATPGPLGPYTVANRSSTPLTVTVAARPWVQSAAGKVSVNRRATLPGVSVGEPTFTLAPGAERQVNVTLVAPPAGGALYGGLEVVGLPADVARRKGVVLCYRLVGTIRILPSTPTLRLVAGNAKVSKGAAVIPVRNTGNTIDQVTGSVSLRGARGSRNRSITAVRILPGKQVNVALGSGLARGSYRATLRLNQAGKRALTVTKRFRVR